MMIVEPRIEVSVMENMKLVRHQSGSGMRKWFTKSNTDDQINFGAGLQALDPFWVLLTIPK